MGALEIIQTDAKSPAELLQTVTPGLVLDLAFGRDEPESVMAMHGYTPEQVAILMDLKPLHAAVLKKKADMDREGMTHQFRAQQLADEALKILAAKLDPSLPTPQVLEIYREVKKSGRMDVVEVNQQANLPTFQIVIETGKSTVSLSANAAQNAVNNVIEGEGSVIEPAQLASAEPHPLPVVSMSNLDDLIHSLDD